MFQPDKRKRCYIPVSVYFTLTLRRISSNHQTSLTSIKKILISFGLKLIQKSEMIYKKNLFFYILQFIFFGNFYIQGIYGQIDSFEIATTIFQNYVKTTSGEPDMCQKNTCCTMSSTERCALNSYERDTSTMILPGGKTRCIAGDSTHYAFQIIPGDKDKLLIYFAGGGACWDEVTTKLGFMCQPNSGPQPLRGALNRTNADHRFAKYTIVHLSYCSGDLHIGNVTRQYKDSFGEPFVQVGLYNVLATLDWIQEQFNNGGLDSTLNELVITGSSAGSIGTQFWSNYILNLLPWKQAAVIPDCYAGVTPKGTFGKLIYDFGYCNAGFLSPALYTKCIQKQLDLIDINLETQALHRDISFSFIESKTDLVQHAFYTAFATSFAIQPYVIPASEFYRKTNEIFGLYNKASPNFLTYLVDGNKHCFSTGTEYFEATTKGYQDKGSKCTGLWLYEWLNQFPMKENDVASTQCEDGFPPLETNCAAKVYPKSFTEHYHDNN